MGLIVYVSFYYPTDFWNLFADKGLWRNEVLIRLPNRSFDHFELFWRCNVRYRVHLRGICTLQWLRRSGLDMACVLRIVNLVKKHPQLCFLCPSPLMVKNLQRITDQTGYHSIMQWVGGKVQWKWGRFYLVKRKN